MADLDANHDIEIISVAAVFGTLMVASFVARIVSIRLRRNAFGLDDLFLTVALLPALTENIWYAIATHTYGIGHHLASLNAGQVVGFEKMFYASGWTQPTALAFAKLSLITLLYRIFAVRPFRITCWILAAIVVAWYVASILATNLNCLPVESLWNPAVPGHCGNQFHIQIAEPVPWIVTDFAVLIAPLPMVRKLHLPRAQRFGLASLFLIGGVTCIASCIRYSTVWYSVNDVTYDIAAATCWNLIEADLGVTVVSLIVTRPVFGRLVPGWLVEKVRSLWTQYLSLENRDRSQTRLFSSFRRMPKDPPMLPSFTDSQIELASKCGQGKDVPLGEADASRGSAFPHNTVDAV